MAKEFKYYLRTVGEMNVQDRSAKAGEELPLKCKIAL